MAIEILSSLIFVLCVAGAAMATDYCNLAFCNKNHIACDFNGDFGRNCPADARVIDMEPNKKLIVDAFNDFRNKIAGGAIDGFEPAARMATMQWDDELAYLATVNAKTYCTARHDRCHNTDQFARSGQITTVFSYPGKESKYNDDEIISERLSEWFGEVKYATMDLIHEYPKKLPKPSPEHFALAVAEKNTHIGCGAVRFTQSRNNRFVMVCNFATDNVVTQPVYSVGEAATIHCHNKMGANPDYPNLCHVDEIYQNNSVKK